MKTRKHLLAAIVMSALALGATQLSAQESPARSYGPGYGPHMMHGYGGHGPGYAMGPWMMRGGWGGDCGFGPGMMGGYAGGPTMHGYGAPGAYGMGPGMMWGNGAGYGPGYGVSLTDDQRRKIDKVQQDLRRKQWDVMGKMTEAHGARYGARDEAAGQQAYKQMASLRRQMLENALTAQKEIEAIVDTGQPAPSTAK